ncbi:MAG: hypothetical protein FJX76_10800 [Armatimonadetes bacterium]|nr:hypothetical protein [Armatimonadota bacterium]
MHGLFSIPLNLFISVVAPPDPASLQSLERGLEGIARDYELTDREVRTLKDSFVEPFRQEGMPLGPDTVEWLQLVNRRLLALPPGAVSAGAQLQWTTLGLARYSPGVTLQQYLKGIKGEDEGEPTPVDPTPVPAALPKVKSARRKGPARRGNGKKK